MIDSRPRRSGAPTAESDASGRHRAFLASQSSTLSASKYDSMAGGTGSPTVITASHPPGMLDRDLVDPTDGRSEVDAVGLDRGEAQRLAVRKEPKTRRVAVDNRAPRC